MKRKIALYTSSITGNTRKVMHAIEEIFEDVDDYVAYETQKVIEQQDLHLEADLHIIGFWCRRTSLDDASIQLIEKMKDQKILLVGTMGNYPDGLYGERVKENVMEIVTRQNQFHGIFLCRGKIEESRTWRRRSLPQDHIHYLNDEGYQRHLSSRNHPNEQDLINAVAFVKNILTRNEF